ncbi:DUF1073 domain-containing protein [Leisingera methylohalidivorans]|uniref:Anti-CBASS protein Acb1-like N-terminal domain-containing protein n=1 Tax=Leisingera methylohalidivorans DSM 14336 TaxID=999552 RepID=V9VRZ4_9RHOB|nr:anti-CBASS Acb1 family protein [Leisingera methylohalidivorans]AHD00469.1 hypothetical protein METH_06820 [Leisingera methylohalidivorans DSM 14336]
MSVTNFFANAARRLDLMVPGYFPEAKHNHYKDFSWPQTLTFRQLHSMYRRNGLASAGVNKTILKTWQDTPEIWETAKAKESPLEKDIRQRFEDLMIWQALAEADRRAMVGGYAGVILRFRDDKRFDQPVDSVRGGLDGLAEVIPAWGGQGAQLEVAEWVTDERSEDYGKPKMFRFNEAAVGKGQNKVRQFMVHPDRVLIWSKDGTIHCESDLEPGYNDLLDAEKVKGAGGEGFYKSARGNPVLEADKEMKWADMAKAMGVPVGELADKMNEQVEDFQKGFDKLLMVQGMQAKTLPVTLPTGDTYFNAAVNSFAASLLIPVKILLGSQTGERASTEDATEWNLVNNARRVNFAKPRIRALLNRLERVEIIPERDWAINWADLTDASKDKKIERAGKMADINKQQQDEPVWRAAEIRAAAGDEGVPPNALSDDGDDL